MFRQRLIMHAFYIFNIFVISDPWVYNPVSPWSLGVSCFDITVAFTCNEKRLNRSKLNFIHKPFRLRLFSYVFNMRRIDRLYIKLQIFNRFLYHECIAINIYFFVISLPANPPEINFTSLEPPNGALLIPNDISLAFTFDQEVRLDGFTRLLLHNEHIRLNI